MLIKVLKRIEKLKRQQILIVGSSQTETWEEICHTNDTNLIQNIVNLYDSVKSQKRK